MDDQPSPAGQPRMNMRQEFLARWKALRKGSIVPDGRIMPAGSGNDLAVSPYPGLRSFQPDEADLFYGRDSQVKDLQELLADHNVIFVLGGSGSGKSSLVRAGLIPQLNSTAPISGRAGAWYVVEFRPKTDPVTELFDALFNQIVAPVLVVESHVEEPASGTAEFTRRIDALNAAFDLRCAPDADIKTIKQAYRTRLRTLLFEGDTVDVGALFDFVDGALQTLDRILSGGMVSDTPNLLILIDQFEEVFKPKVDVAGRNMVMSLITSVHTYKPYNLFLVVTMRSEELHRCAEFLGLADVVNKSFYLVDLIGGKDIEQAVVGPARRLLKSWDLDPGSPDTGPFTRRALSKLHRTYDEARKKLPHPADQLPLLQHLLPLVWDKAVERWQKVKDGKPLVIDLRDFESLPGWTNAEGALIGTLNERADDVLRGAIDIGASKSNLDQALVEQLLRVAFCCLAQLDDRGNVVRDFATLGQMLDASGVFERQPPEGQVACRTALEAALHVFQQATLINISTTGYDVNHEAFIRGWNEYATWLQQARSLENRLVTVDAQIQSAKPPDRNARALQRWIDGVTEWISVRKLAKADQITGDETSSDLQDVVGNNRTFSDQWAQKILNRDESASTGAPVKRAQITDRLKMIRRTIDDAIKYRSGAKDRPRNLLAALLGVVLVGGVVFSVYWITTEKNSEAQNKLAEQFRFFRLQSGAVTASSDRLRSLGEDREVYAALTMGPELAGRAGTDPDYPEEAQVVMRNSIRSLEKAARDILSDVSIRIVRNFSEFDDKTRSELSDCAVVNPDEPKDLFAKPPINLGIRLEPKQSNNVTSVTMIPVWRASRDKSAYPIESSTFGPQSLPPGLLVCLSHDANWFLMWSPSIAPQMQRIAWIRTTKSTSEPDNKWRAEGQVPRQVATFMAYNNYLETLGPEYSRLIQMTQDDQGPVRSFRSEDGRTGFWFPISGGRTAVAWTNTALTDADPVAKDQAPQFPKLCDFKSTSCEMEKSKFDNQEHRLEVVPVAGKFACKSPTDICFTELRIEFDPRDNKGASLRTSILHRSSPVTGARIEAGFLWLSDSNGQFWRYWIGSDPFKRLLEHRWKGVDRSVVAGIPYSDACKAILDHKCDGLEIQHWPKSKDSSR